MQKKIFVLPLVLLLFSFALHAQVDVKFGLKGGVNFSAFRGSDAPQTTLLTGPHVGGLAQFVFGRDDEGFMSYALQPEILYSQQGAKMTDGKTVLSYVNIPIMIQRFVASSGFYIETGPQIGFLMSAKATSGTASEDIKSELKSIDFAFNGGLGYQFGSGLGINVRYSAGLTSIDKSGADLHNGTISGGLSYVFGNNSSE